jgi:hypothetical protein
MKNLISAVSIVLIASVIYLWGHADGSAGKLSSLFLSTSEHSTCTRGGFKFGDFPRQSDN